MGFLLVLAHSLSVTTGPHPGEPLCLPGWLDGSGKGVGAQERRKVRGKAGVWGPGLAEIAVPATGRTAMPAPVCSATPGATPAQVGPSDGAWGLHRPRVARLARSAVHAALVKGRAKRDGPAVELHGGVERDYAERGAGGKRQHRLGRPTFVSETPEVACTVADIPGPGSPNAARATPLFTGPATRRPSAPSRSQGGTGNPKRRWRRPWPKSPPTLGAGTYLRPNEQTVGQFLEGDWPLLLHCLCACSFVVM